MWSGIVCYGVVWCGLVRHDGCGEVWRDGSTVVCVAIFWLVWFGEIRAVLCDAVWVACEKVQ